MSVCASTGWPRHCCGLMYGSVPIRAPSWDREDFASTCRARPKSTILRDPSPGDRMMFAGSRSRWTSPARGRGAALWRSARRARPPRGARSGGRALLDPGFQAAAFDVLQHDVRGGDRFAHLEDPPATLGWLRRDRLEPPVRGSASSDPEKASAELLDRDETPHPQVLSPSRQRRRLLSQWLEQLEPSQQRMEGAAPAKRIDQSRFHPGEGRSHRFVAIVETSRGSHPAAASPRARRYSTSISTSSTSRVDSETRCRPPRADPGDTARCRERLPTSKPARTSRETESIQLGVRLV